MGPYAWCRCFWNSSESTPTTISENEAGAVRVKNVKLLIILIALCRGLRFIAQFAVWSMTPFKPYDYIEPHLPRRPQKYRRTINRTGRCGPIDSRSRINSPTYSPISASHLKIRFYHAPHDIPQGFNTATFPFPKSLIRSRSALYARMDFRGCGTHLGGAPW